MAYAAAHVPVAVVSGAFRREIEPVLTARGLLDYVTVARRGRRRRAREARSRGLPAAPSPRSAATCVRTRSSPSRTRRRESRRRRRPGCTASHFSARTRRAPRCRRRARRGHRCRARPASARVTLVIAHRGACWELPENTLAAFERAIELERGLRRARRARDERRHARGLPRPPGGRRTPSRGGRRSASREDRDHVRAQDPVALPTTRHGAEVRRAPPRGRDRALVRCASPARRCEDGASSSTSASARRSSAPHATRGASASTTAA